MEVGLFPSIAEHVVVALHAVEAQSEKGAGGAAASFISSGPSFDPPCTTVTVMKFVSGFVVQSPSAETRSRTMSCRAGSLDLVAKPGHEAAASVNEKGSGLDSDKRAGEALGE